jgi:hypothetical protein
MCPHIVGILIHNPQFSARHWDLFPHAAAAPTEGDEHEDDAANDELFHGIPPGAIPAISSGCHGLPTAPLAEEHR